MMKVPGVDYSVSISMYYGLSAKVQDFTYNVMPLVQYP